MQEEIEFYFCDKITRPLISSQEWKSYSPPNEVGVADSLFWR